MSGDTLQNCTLELATMGDLKLVEKPQPIVLAPHDFCNIKASVKVASTENGIIFGNIGICLNYIFIILWFNFIIYLLQFMILVVQLVIAM